MLDWHDEMPLQVHWNVPDGQASIAVWATLRVDDERKAVMTRAERILSLMSAFFTMVFLCFATPRTS
jgi:hypothetical protein